MNPFSFFLSFFFFGKDNSSIRFFGRRLIRSARGFKFRESEMQLRVSLHVTIIT